VHEDPNVSVRKIARQVGASKSTVWRILHREQMHPYHYVRIQALNPEDYPRRYNFCEWLVTYYKLLYKILHLLKMLFTDEANFSRNEVLNLRNMHSWAYINLHVVREVHHHHLFSINVWSGIFGNELPEPFILPNRLNGNAYLNFLQNNLINNCIDDLPLRRSTTNHDVVNYLNVKFQNQWIGIVKFF
jgi:hypothetical protein